MKKISFYLLMILIVGISTGCDKDKDFLSYEEIASIYYENRELINNIKDGLFSSSFIPHNGMTGEYRYSTLEGKYVPIYSSVLYNALILHYDYNNGKLFCIKSGDNPIPLDEKLQSIQNVHNDAIEYFMRINKNYNPCIEFSKIRHEEDVVIIEFVVHNPNNNSNIVATSVMYTTNPEIFSGLVHIEDNWYACRYRRV